LCAGARRRRTGPGAPAAQLGFTVDFAHLDEVEIGELTGSAWLTVDEVKAVDEGIFPVPVADLAKRLVGGEVPGEPVELAWVGWRGDDKRFPLG
jgi:hypothetical protein